MNGCRGCKVPPRSILEIRNIAEQLRALIGNIPIGKFLDILLAEGLLDVVPDNDQRLARKVEAVYSPEDKCIRLRDRDYEACVLGTNPRSIFTFWHEFGHFVLGHERSFSRDESRSHKIYEDSEWQADTFAGEYLMPFSVIEKEKLLTPEAVSRKFGVSKLAAQVRLKKLKRI